MKPFACSVLKDLRSMMFLVGLCCTAADAGPITSANVRVSGLCGGTQASSGTSNAAASFACTAVFMGVPVSYSATASGSAAAGAIISGIASDMRVIADAGVSFATAQQPPIDSDAISTAGFLDPVVVLGGTGTGTIAFLFQTFGSSEEDSRSTTSVRLDVLQNGVSIAPGPPGFGPGFLVCTQGIGLQFCDHLPGSLIRPPFMAKADFTFGIPFTLQARLVGDSSSIGDFGSIDVTAQLIGFAITQNGQPVSGSVQVVPEPSSGWMALGGAFLLLACALAPTVPKPRVRRGSLWNRFNTSQHRIVV